MTSTRGWLHPLKVYIIENRSATSRKLSVSFSMSVVPLGHERGAKEERAVRRVVELLVFGDVAVVVERNALTARTMPGRWPQLSVRVKFSVIESPGTGGSSAADLGHLGVDEGLGHDGGGHEPIEVSNLYCCTGFCATGRNPGVGDRRTDGVSERGAGDVAGGFTVHQDGLVAEYHRRAVVDLQADQLLARRCRRTSRVRRRGRGIRPSAGVPRSRGLPRRGCARWSCRCPTTGSPSPCAGC